jgi:hypothetical protein
MLSRFEKLLKNICGIDFFFPDENLPKREVKGNIYKLLAAEALGVDKKEFNLARFLWYSRAAFCASPPP